jgi:hypothetical protein
MKTLLTLLAISFVFCGLASAGTLTLDCTTGSSPLEFFSDTFDVGPNCPTFTLAGATLESAQVTLNILLSGTVNLTNLNGAGDIPNVYAVVVSRVFFRAEGQDVASSMNNPLTLTIQTVPQTLGPGNTSFPVAANGSLVGPTVAINTPFLEEFYVGAGIQAVLNHPYIFFLGFEISTQSSFGSTGNTDGDLFPNMLQVSPVVTYTYSSASDVPEPGNLLTMGVGLLGMAGAFKRLRSS